MVRRLKTMRARVEWMDTLRGAAIVLVILNHAIYNVQQAYDDAPDWVVLINDLLAPVRMPAMVFLSGLLLAGSLEKGAGRYIDGKLRKIAWPFLIWTLIGYAYELTDFYLGEGALDVPGPIEALVTPIGHLWFLQNIFLFYVLALALKDVTPLLPATAALVVGLFLDGDALRFATLFACFMVGAWFSWHAGVFEMITRRGWALAVASVVALSLCVLGVAGVDMRAVVRYEVFSVVFVAAAVLLTSRAAMAVAHQRWVALLRYIGRNSLIFYLVHGYPLIIAATLTMRATGSGLAAIAMGLLVGMITSWVAAVLHERFPVFRIFFEFPSRERRPVRARP